MTAIAFRRDIEMPSVWTAYGYALGFHVVMFLWNPTLMSGGSANHAPVLMQVEFRDHLPVPVVPKPPVVVKKAEPKPVVKKAHKSGLALAHNHIAPITLHKPKPMIKQAAAPAPRTRISQVKIPKFIPHASDDDSLAMVNHPAKLATTTALHAPTAMNSAPTLHAKTRGVRASDVQFELSDRGTINPGAQIVNIPIGESSGETAMVASAPQLHNAPKGVRSISGSSYQAPKGEGVGELAGRNRAGYHGTIQVGGAEPSDEEVVAAAGGKGHGGAIGGQGFELGGPIGDRRILRRHLPEYPQWAEEKGISAMVKIFFTVNSDGSIRPLMRIVRSSGYAELDDLAKQALKTWKFSPTTADSTQDNAWGVITFRFTLA